MSSSGRSPDLEPGVGEHLVAGAARGPGATRDRGAAADSGHECPAQARPPAERPRVGDPSGAAHLSCGPGREVADPDPLGVGRWRREVEPDTEASGTDGAAARAARRPRPATSTAAACTVVSRSGNGRRSAARGPRTTSRRTDGSAGGVRPGGDHVQSSTMPRWRRSATKSATFAVPPGRLVDPVAVDQCGDELALAVRARRGAPTGPARCRSP